MSWRERRLWQRLMRNDTEISPTGEFVQTESLDALTTTATFAPSKRPSLSSGDTITYEFIDLDTGITRYQFGGLLLTTDTESEPQDTSVPCQGPLGMLNNARKYSDGDLLLTGMTDEEVVRTIIDYVGLADYCGANYDDSEIHGAGYVLGELADPMDPEDPANIWWRAGDSGASVVSALDDLFFMKTLEIQNCRIVRLFYDTAPDGTGVYRMYTKGSTRDLFSVHRTYGQVDSIVNTFIVNGLSRECGPDGACQCTIYSKAYDANPKLTGRSGTSRPRTVRGEYQSDLIQNTEVAEWKVRELMKRNNRPTDEVVLELINDPQVHPCSVIGLRDTTTYIDANPRYYTVTTVDRHGTTMTLTCVGGTAGEEGTVSTGVDKVCNRTESSDTASGPSIDPPVEFPPLDDGTSFDNLFDPGDLTEITPPDTTHAFTDCTEVDTTPGSPSYALAICANGATPFSNVDEGVWRDTGGASNEYVMVCRNIPCECDVDRIIFYGGGSAFITMNETTPYSAKNSGNDFTLGIGPVFTVTCEVKFNVSFHTLQFHFGDGGNVTLVPYPGGGLSPAGMDDITYTALLDTENENAYISGNQAEHSCTHPVLHKNNGGVRQGTGIPLGTWTPITITYDFASPQQRVYYGGPDGGYIEDTLECSPFPGYPHSPTPCDDTEHFFTIQAGTVVGSTFSDPTIEIRGLAVGHTTCVANPDFDPETLDGYLGGILVDD